MESVERRRGSWNPLDAELEDTIDPMRDRRREQMRRRQIGDATVRELVTDIVETQPPAKGPKRCPYCGRPIARRVRACGPHRDLLALDPYYTDPKEDSLDDWH